MKAFIESVARNLAECPDEVHISETDGDDGKTLVLELQCHPDDVGRLIGRGGRTINALRTLLVTAAARAGTRVALEIATADGGSVTDIASADAASTD